MTHQSSNHTLNSNASQTSQSFHLIGLLQFFFSAPVFLSCHHSLSFDILYLEIIFSIPSTTFPWLLPLPIYFFPCFPLGSIKIFLFYFSFPPFTRFLFFQLCLPSNFAWFTYPPTLFLLSVRIRLQITIRNFICLVSWWTSSLNINLQS